MRGERAFVFACVAFDVCALKLHGPSPTETLRGCPTCNIDGPISLCDKRVLPYFKEVSQSCCSCTVRDNCGNGVDRAEQLPAQVQHFHDKDQHLVIWNDEMERILVKAVRNKEDISPMDYPHAAQDLIEALDKHSVHGKSVLVAGSISPWIEAILNDYGAQNIATSDYVDRVTRSNLTKFINVRDLKGKTAIYDAIFSFSSIEHDGLGRYCDPINPNGDLAAMAEFHQWLKPNGRLYLGVPIGSEEPVLINGNKGRIFGRKRFEMLINGFTWHDTIWTHWGPAPWPNTTKSENQPWHILEREP